MYQDIIVNLSINEQKQLGIYIETEIEQLETKKQRDQRLISNPEFIYKCKVIHIGAYFNLSITNYKITDVNTLEKNIYLIYSIQLILGLDCLLV